MCLLPPLRHDLLSVLSTFDFQFVFVLHVLYVCYNFASLACFHFLTDLSPLWFVLQFLSTSTVPDHFLSPTHIGSFRQCQIRFSESNRARHASSWISHTFLSLINPSEKIPNSQGCALVFKFLKKLCMGSTGNWFCVKTHVLCILSSYVVHSILWI